MIAERHRREAKNYFQETEDNIEIIGVSMSPLPAIPQLK